MSAVPNPSHRPQQPQSQRPKRRVAPAPQPKPTVLPLPARPLWSIALGVVQQATAPLALGAFVATVGTYSLTVCQWQAWNQADRELARLQQQERQLQFDSSAREQELAQMAEKSELVLWDPEKTIFLKPAPLPARPAPAPVPPSPPPVSLEIPLAY